jgi:hypothetical protein
MEMIVEITPIVAVIAFIACRAERAANDADDVVGERFVFWSIHGGQSIASDSKDVHCA